MGHTTAGRPNIAGKEKSHAEWLFYKWPITGLPRVLALSIPRDVKLRFAAGPGRTWALLAGSEAPDSLTNREPRASLAVLLLAVDRPFAMLPVIN